MGIEIIKNVKKLIELLLSPFKKNFSDEYYKNKNIKSIFYFNDCIQTESTLNELKRCPTLKKAQIQYIQNNNSQNIAEVIIQSKISPKQAKKIENLISKFNTENSRQPNVSIESSVQKLESLKEGRSLKTNLPYENVKPMTSYGIEELEKIDATTQSKKLSDNPNFSKIKQELENKLKNSFESNSKNTSLLSSKNKEQEKEQVCKENVLSFISSFKDISILPIEPKTKQEPVISNNNNSSIPPLPPPIGGLANFRGPKLPLSLPIQEQSKTKQEKFCNTSQNKIVNMKSNLNNVLLMEQLTLTLEQRKGKVHSV